MKDFSKLQLIVFSRSPEDPSQSDSGLHPAVCSHTYSKTDCFGLRK